MEQKSIYIGKVEVIRNPSPADYQAIRREALKIHTPVERNGDPALRSCEDTDGNKYYWAAADGMHEDIEPRLEQITGTDIFHYVGD